MMLNKLLILIAFLGALGLSVGTLPMVMSWYDPSYVVTYVMPLWLLVVSGVAMFASLGKLI